MASAIRSLTKVQIGKEGSTSKGTAVAATRRLILRNATYRRQEAQDQLDDTLHGTLARTAVAPVPTEHHTEAQFQFPLDFTQILFPLLSGVKGGVTPTVVGSGSSVSSVRLWTFNLDADTDPAPDTYTLEFAEKSPADEAGMEAPFGFTTQWEIDGRDEGTPTVSMSLAARKTQDAAPTTGLSIPTVVRVANSRWSASMHDSSTAFGSTGSTVLGQIYGLRFQFSGNVRPERYLDNRANLDFSKYEIGNRVGDLTFDVVHDPASGKFVQTEEGKKANQTIRFVRALVTGETMTTAQSTGQHTYFFRIDGAYYHAPDSLEERGQDRDGNLITRVHLLSGYDSTWAKDLSFAVRNVTASFP